MYAVQHGAGEGRSYLMEHNAILDSKLSLSSNIPLYAQLVGIIKREINVASPAPATPRNGAPNLPYINM